MLSCLDLHKSFHARRRKTDVLCGVDFQLAPGECVAVIGKSGCGKTTLLLTLAGMLRPDRGNVLWDGRDFTDFTGPERRDLWNQKLGFVFQSFQLVPYLTAQENVALAVRHADRRERARELLVQLELEHRLDNKPNSLSAGEQQRVALARALVNHPPVLLADEPTGNLDATTGDEVHRLLAGFRDRGGSVLVVSHRPQTQRIADRVLELYQGRLHPREPTGLHDHAGDDVAPDGTAADAAASENLHNRSTRCV